MRNTIWIVERWRTSECWRNSRHLLRAWCRCHTWRSSENCWRGRQGRYRIAYRKGICLQSSCRRRKWIFECHLLKIQFMVQRVNKDMDFLIDGQLCCHFFFWQVDSMRRDFGTQITSWGLIFWTIIFYYQKICVKIYVSNEGSNFILSLQEVDHWVAQT